MDLKDCLYFHLASGDVVFLDGRYCGKCLYHYDCLPEKTRDIKKEGLQ